MADLNSVETNVGRITTSVGKLKKALADDKEALTKRKVAVPEGAKHSDIAELIDGLKTPVVYGVRVEQENPDPDKRVTYTDDAEGMEPVAVNAKTGRCILGAWGDTWIFDKIYPVMLMPDGSDYRLDKNDLSKKEGGDVWDQKDIEEGGNVMVKVNKFYSQFLSGDGFEYYRVCDEPLSGFDPVGFVGEDGKEVDCFYMPCYMGSLDEKGRLRSVSGKPMKNGIPYDEAVLAAKENGDGFGIEAHAQITVMDILYLILLKNENSQTAVGYGRGVSVNDATHEASQVYDTGDTDTLGPIGRYVEGLNTEEGEGGAVTFLWMEDYWFANSGSGEGEETNKAEGYENANGYRWMDGLISKDNSIFTKMNPPYSKVTEAPGGDLQTDFEGYEYTRVTDIDTTMAGFTSKSVASNSWGRIGAEHNGEIMTYQCDHTGNNNEGSEPHIYFRGHGGIWYRNHNITHHVHYSVGAAISYIPPAKEEA